MMDRHGLSELALVLIVKGSNMGRTIYTILFMLFVASSVNAQLLNKRGEEVHPYYISFDAPLPQTIEDIRGEFLSISYRDGIGKSESIKLTVINSKNKLVRELNLVKQFGQNFFDIRLENYNISFEENESYVCRLTNEDYEVLERTIRYLPEVKNEIAASIVVKPKQLACEFSKKSGGNLIEFFGDISGGKAPYKVNWYVMNAARSEFLYQPANVVISAPGQTSSIQVDKDPAYYVLMHVTDACGNEQISTVQIVCEQNEKSVNTIFFSKLTDAVPKTMEFHK